MLAVIGFMALGFFYLRNITYTDTNAIPAWASLGVAALWLRRRPPATDHKPGGLEHACDLLGPHRWFAISAALGVFSFFLVLTGGTGRFAALRGHVQVRYTLDPGAESSQGTSAGEYWFER